MSLRARVIALVALMLVVSVLLYVGMSWSSARSNLAAELASARTGGLQTVRSAFEDLPRSDHVRRDLQQLVATFNGNRHLTAELVDPSGRVEMRSSPELPQVEAPRWFASSLRPDLSQLSIPVPDETGDILRLRPEPASDIAALWAATVRAAGVFVLAAALGLSLIYWVIGRALAPLADLSRGLDAIGASGYRERVLEQGPPELHDLQSGFNAMAGRLEEIDERNRALEAQLLTIQDEERAEIASDLHDEIGPHLFAVALDAEMIGQCVSRGEMAPVQSHLQSIQSAVSYVQRQVRDLIASLRPTRAAELGLEAAVEDLIRFWQTRQPEVRFEAAVEHADLEVPEPLRDVVYRVVQEAVANALRHADTKQLSIHVATKRAAIVAGVTNRGQPKSVISKHPGLGLMSMRERVHAAGGELNIDRGDEGWTVLATFPSPVERDMT